MYVEVAKNRINRGQQYKLDNILKKLNNLQDKLDVPVMKGRKWYS